MKIMILHGKKNMENINTKHPKLKKTNPINPISNRVRIIMENPHPNIATYYSVNEQFVDMELLDTDTPKNNEKMITTMSSVKDFLQNLGIMYIDWKKMDQFLKASVDLSLKAIVFANLYLEDGTGIPFDRLRRSIFTSRANFKNYMMKNFGLRKVGQKSLDFYIINSDILEGRFCLY